MPESEYFLDVTCSVTGQAWRNRLTDHRGAQAISQKYDLPDILGRVLAARGVAQDAVEAFLSPTLRDLMPAASTMCDLNEGAARIADAIVTGEKIGVIGDYDVDGISSSALLHRYLAQLGANFLIHIPHRLDEGYGPNENTLDRFKTEDVDLAITVDCGISAHDPMSHAKALGIEVVIVDHHQAGLELPQAHSIINPNRQDDLSNQGQLCAAGVCFVLLAKVHAHLKNIGHFNDDTVAEPDLLGLLDLVALATVCDVVPLTGLNRALVRQGFKVMARRDNRGLAKLSDAAGLRRRPDVHAAGFVIGPRINAAGRLGFSEKALDLLTTADPARAAGIAQELEAFNKQRQAIELEVFDQAIAQGQKAIGEAADTPLLIVTGEGWHPGVLGLVAGRLKERFGRPAIAVGFEPGGTGQGSGRSIPGVDLGGAIRDAVTLEHLIKGGGHPMAAGITLDKSKLGDFRAFMEERLLEATDAAISSARLDIDGAMSAGGATIELIELLDRAGPFGMGNPTPRFVFPGHRIAYSDLAGQEHVRCTLVGPENKRLGGIAFRVLGAPLGELLLSSGEQPVHVAGRLSINDWGGKRTAQLMIDDAVVAT